MKTSKKAAQKAALANEAPVSTGMAANQEVSPVAEQDVPFAPEPTTTATAAEQGAPKPPAKPAAKKGTTKKAAAPKAKKAAKPAGKKAAKAAKPKADKPVRESKGAMVLAMIARPKGATLDEIMNAAGWQRHTVRGFISIQGRKPGIDIESTKSEDGARTYRMAK